MDLLLVAVHVPKLADIFAPQYCKDRERLSQVWDSESVTDLNALVIFAHVVEANSFSEAARRLNIPVSTLSRRVAELEDQLGLRLLHRSTRRLRLTDAGSDLLEYARQGAQISAALGNIASDHGTAIAGKLRLSAPPSISDSLLAPLIQGFQTLHPAIRLEVFITERLVDHIADGVDLTFRIGQLKDSALIGRKLLSYRHRLLASRDYLQRFALPETPDDLLNHRLLTFSRRKPGDRWIFEHVNGHDRQTIFFEPHLSMNDYAGLAPAIRAGIGIGELPPIVQAYLACQDELVEVMPDWRFRTFDLWLLHLSSKHLSRAVRAFKDFAAEQTNLLFPHLRLP